MIKPKYKNLFFACFVLIIGLMAVDFFNPSLPYIMHHFRVTQSKIKSLMIVYMISLGLAQFFYGGYSDIHGRKRSVLLALLVATLGLILSAISWNIEVLYLSRIITAFGMAGCVVISRAMIIDIFVDKIALKKAFSFFTMSSQLSPAVAPIIGGTVQQYSGWRETFLTLTVVVLLSVGLLFKYMSETAVLAGVQSMPRNMIRTYLTLLQDIQFIAYSLISALIFVFTIAYYSFSPFVFHRMGYPPTINGVLYLFYTSGIVSGSLILRYCLVQLNSRRLLLGCTLSLAMLFLAALLFNVDSSILSIIIFSYSMALLCGITAPLSLALCMENMTQHKGSASALQGFIKMFFTGLFLIAFNFIFITSFKDITKVFIGLTVAIGVLWALAGVYPKSFTTKQQ